MAREPRPGPPGRLGRLRRLQQSVAQQREAEPGGDDLLAILRAYCITDSVRKAAALVYRHHSTVAYRLEHAEAVLGFELDNPQGRFRLSLALVMRALR